MGSDAGQVDPTVIEFDHEQDVQAGQPDGLDGEEIAGERSAGLRTQELRPGWAVAAGCRSEMTTAQNCPYRGSRHRHAELAALADNAHVSPPGILPRQA